MRDDTIDAEFEEGRLEHAHARIAELEEALRKTLRAANNQREHGSYRLNTVRVIARTALKEK